MDLSDEALVERFRQTKDTNHFRSLVRRYQNRIYNAAFRILGSAEEAEEVVQETYIKVHQNLGRFRPQSTFSAWIFRIAHNLCIDLIRTKHRKKGFALLSFDPQSSFEDDGKDGPVAQIADRAPCPAQQLDLDEETEIIQQSLRELPESQRAVVVLHDIEGFSYQEIAEIVDASIGTVRSRLHYGRLKLRELLDPYFSQASTSPLSR